MSPSHPGDMTLRARWYLTIAASRHILTAGFAFITPQAFQSSSFDPIMEVADLWFWGAIFAGAGIVCAYAALQRSEAAARLGLSWSAISTLLIAVGLLIAWWTGDLSSPTGPIIWSAVAAKDFTVCADPIRSPFERLADEIEQD